jgi:CBS domain-containing protein
MQIKDVMTEEVTFADVRTPIVELARRMRNEDIGALPIVDNDRVVGIVTDRDIVVRVVAEGQDNATTTAREAMSPNILYCFDDQTVERILQNMAENQVRRLPVVNRAKRLVGVVSLGDLSQTAQKRAGDTLKEISRPDHH